MLEIELNKNIKNIKFEFKNKELYFTNYKDESNVPVLEDMCVRGVRELFNKLIHS